MTSPGEAAGALPTGRRSLGKRETSEETGPTSAAMHGGRLPPSIEDGAAPPDDLSEFRPPAMVVVIPFAASVAHAAAE